MQVTYLRRIPKDTGVPGSGNRMGDILRLIGHLWSLLLVLELILGFGFQVVTSVLVSISAAILIYRVRPGELKIMFRSAFERKMIINTFLVLVLKELIAYTGVLELLPEAMAVLPLPTYLIFALLFFAATVISGILHDVSCQTYMTDSIL